MARIFVSYAHEDQAATKRIVDALAREGLEVWWDHEIPPGRSWDEVIVQRVGAADVTIVIWSTRSVASNFVKEEAQIAHDQGKLLPVKIDEVEPPVGFRRVHAANLINWRGDAEHRQWRALLGEIHQRLGAAPQPTRVTPPRKPLALFIGLAALVLLGGSIGAFLATQSRPVTNTPDSAQTSEGDQTLAEAVQPQPGAAPSQAAPARADQLAARDPAAPRPAAAPDPAAAALNRVSARDWSLTLTLMLAQRVLEEDAVPLASLRAAAIHDARAQTVLGSALEHNVGGAGRNHSEAVRLYRLAANQGFARGQTNLGRMYRGGMGVSRDDAEAARLFRLAADQGNAIAQHELADLYVFGYGVSADHTEARRLRQLAARQGYQPAQQFLTNTGESW